jgi:hypothetical protein
VSFILNVTIKPNMPSVAIRILILHAECYLC